MAQAEHHALVDVLGAAHAFAEGEGRLVDHLTDDSREHAAGSWLNALGVQAQPLEGGFAGLAGDLDQLQRGNRIERLAVHGPAQTFDVYPRPRGPAASARRASATEPTPSTIASALAVGGSGSAGL